MIIYTDIITGDKMFSDSHRIKEVDGIAYEADCQNIMISGKDSDIGANPSADEEGGDEDSDDPKEVIDIVHFFKLKETSFDKKSYLAALKDYREAIKNHLKASGKSDDEVQVFETKSAAFGKKIINNFPKYEFLVGESLNPAGMIVLLSYRKDNGTPYLTLWKDGLGKIEG